MQFSNTEERHWGKHTLKVLKQKHFRFKISSACIWDHFLMENWISVYPVPQNQTNLKVIDVRLLLQPFAWTGPSTNMCSPLMATATEKPSTCIWTYAMTTTSEATTKH